MTKDRLEQPPTRADLEARVAQDGGRIRHDPALEEQIDRPVGDDGTVAECQCGQGLTPADLKYATGNPICSDCIADEDGPDPRVLIP